MGNLAALMRSATPGKYGFPCSRLEFQINLNVVILQDKRECLMRSKPRWFMQLWVVVLFSLLFIGWGLTWVSPVAAGITPTPTPTVTPTATATATPTPTPLPPTVPPPVETEVPQPTTTPIATPIPMLPEAGGPVALFPLGVALLLVLSGALLGQCLWRRKA